jgi:hypothetical protein
LQLSKHLGELPAELIESLVNFAGEFILFSGRENGCQLCHQYPTSNRCGEEGPTHHSHKPIRHPTITGGPEPFIPAIGDMFVHLGILVDDESALKPMLFEALVQQVRSVGHQSKV